MGRKLKSASAELFSGNVPTLYQRSTIKDFHRDSTNEAALDVVEEYLENFDQHGREATGVCLIGPPQTGKTLLACILLNHILVPFKEGSSWDRQRALSKFGSGQDEPGFPGYFLTLGQYIQLHLRRMRLSDLMKSTSGETADLYREYRETDTLINALEYRVQLLVIDDVGKEHRTDSGFAESEFDFLIRQRQHFGLPTIYTSNHTLDSWSLSTRGDGMYHESVAPFIRNTTKIAVIEDERKPSARRNAHKRVSRSA